MKLVINLVGASEVKQRTLREVPLANRRLNEDCVPVGNECVYKRHYRKYSRILWRYNTMVSKRQAAARCRPLWTFLLLDLGPKRQQNFENGRHILDYSLGYILYLPISCFYTCTLPNSPCFDIDNAFHGTPVGLQPPLISSHEWQVCVCVCCSQATRYSSPVRLFLRSTSRRRASEMLAGHFFSRWRLLACPF